MNLLHRIRDIFTLQKGRLTGNDVIQIQKHRHPPIFWSNLIPVDISMTQRDEAFKVIFGHPVDQCKITVNGPSDIVVQTPDTIFAHGGFGYYTDSPVVASDDEIYYTGAGPDWGIDLRGKRYYKLDSETGLPVDWLRVQAERIVAKSLYTFEI
jgi:hypothetical protein